MSENMGSSMFKRFIICFHLNKQYVLSGYDDDGNSEHIYSVTFS